MQNKKRTIFIWDIHGCYYEFRDLIKKLNIQNTDKVYLVGDMINKWKYSYKVLKFLFKNKEQYSAVLWNNEIDFLRYIDWDNFYKTKIFKKLKKKLNKRPEILSYLKSLELYIEEEAFLLIHAWLNPDKDLDNHTDDEITNIRYTHWKPWYELYKWTKKVVYWHWALNWLNLYKNTIGIDTWCVYWKWLSAYILETWDIMQVPARELYVNVFNRNI